ncbi:helix-turn-helix domain-containing protein [Actinokineospora sp. 24-640]
MVEVEGAHRLSLAAEVFGVSERSVGTWWRAYRRDGRGGLATRRGRPGPAELIGPRDRGTLFVGLTRFDGQGR